MTRKFLIFAALVLICIASLTQAQQPQPLPLAGRNPVELLTNGGFEIDVNTDKIPDGWEVKNTALPKPDKIKCDKPGKLVAHSGSCAFMFRGNPDGTSSTLSQKITDVSSVTDGATLQFSAYIDPRSGVPGATVGKVTVKLSDGQQIKLSLAIPTDELRIPADYIQISESTTLNLVGTSVVKIKVKFLNKATGGRFVLDDASLTLDENIATATFTSTLQSTSTPTLMVTDTSTSIPSETFTPSATFTWTPSSTSTEIPTNPPTAGPTPTPTITKSPTLTPVTPTSTSTETPTNTPIPTPFKLIASDGVDGDHFGKSVAISGNTVVVGAYWKQNYQGAAYVYNWNGSSWVEQAKLTPDDAFNGDRFGEAVAINGDTIIIGAPQMGDKGKIYVFTRTGNIWTQQAKLTASDAADRDSFGNSVAMTDDTIVIGAYLKNNFRGAAYVFTHNDHTWTQQAKLTASDTAEGDHLGKSVAIAGDTIVIGAPEKDKGAAYVFTRNGSIWTQQTKLTASDASYNSDFGSTVAIVGDTILIGASSKNNYLGGVYSFIFNGTAWVEQQQLPNQDVDTYTFFGEAISMSEDMAVIGAVDVNNGQARAYIFKRSGNTWTQYTNQTVNDIAGNDYALISVALDDTRAIVGAAFGTMGVDWGQGAAWVFDIP